VRWQVLIHNIWKSK